MKAMALALAVGLFSCVYAAAQPPCVVGPPISENYQYPPTYGTKEWQSVRYKDGVTRTVVVVDGQAPSFTEVYHNGVIYRTYTYPAAAKAPAPAKKADPVTKPAPSAEEKFKAAVEALSKEVDELKKEVDYYKKEAARPEVAPPPKESPLPKVETKGPPPDGPVSPIRRPAPSSKAKIIESDK